MFDEPLTGLDPHGIRSLKASIRERADKGTAVLVSSHLLAMVEDLCTHILILHAGQERFFGTLEELKQQFFQKEQNATLERIFFLATQPDTESEELLMVKSCTRLCSRKELGNVPSPLGDQPAVGARWPKAG